MVSTGNRTACAQPSTNVSQIDEESEAKWKLTRGQEPRGFIKAFQQQRLKRHYRTRRNVQMLLSLAPKPECWKRAVSFQNTVDMLNFPAIRGHALHKCTLENRAKQPEAHGNAFFKRKTTLPMADLPQCVKGELNSLWDNLPFWVGPC